MNGGPRLVLTIVSESYGHVTGQGSTEEDHWESGSPPHAVGTKMVAIEQPSGSQSRLTKGGVTDCRFSATRKCSELHFPSQLAARNNQISELSFNCGQLTNNDVRNIELDFE